MKYAVIDDDKQFLNYFYQLTKDYSKNNKFDFYDRPVNFLKVVEAKKEIYDVIFLDIDMPDINGIELSKKIYNEVDREVIIIFLTNKKEMVYDAFGLNVLMFLYKPEFKGKLEYVFKLIDSTVLSTQIITLKTMDGPSVVRIKDIQYIEKIKRKICFYTKQDKLIYTTYKQLNETDLLIDHPFFVYINRSVRINLIYVQKIVNNKLYLKTGTWFEISQSRINEVKDLFLKVNSNVI